MKTGIYHCLPKEGLLTGSVAEVNFEILTFETNDYCLEFKTYSALLDYLIEVGRTFFITFIGVV